MMSPSLTPTPALRLSWGQRLQDIKNRFDYALRTHLQWRKAGFSEPAEDTTPLFAQEPTLQGLIQHYELRPVLQHCHPSRAKEILTRLQELETALTRIQAAHPSWATPLTEPEANSPESNRAALQVLDVGARNWSYVPALWQGLIHHFPQANLSLTGIELDGYRIYTDGFSRADYAEAYCQQLAITSPHRLRYKVGDVLKHKPEHGQFQLIFCFLPFVFPEPCMDWGLPIHFFQPEAFLRHLVSLLTPEGWLMLVNQESEEYEEQGRLLSKLSNNANYINITAHPLGRLSDDAQAFQHAHWGWLVQNHTGLS